MYGYAVGKERTGDLVRAAFDRVLAQASGPRFVAGDFNLEPGEVPRTALLRQHGFRELQEVARIKFGRDPEVTCRQATQKDFLYLSPELQASLLGAEVSWDFFADHGVLAGTFQLAQRDCATFTWRVPQQRRSLPAGFAMPSADVQEMPTDCPQEGYRLLWQRYEDRFSAALAREGVPQLHAQERGRACAMDVRVRRSPVVPPAHGRENELRPAFQEHSLKYAHWYRQLRRLQALRQALRRNSLTDSAALHTTAWWHAVVTAPGFAQGFRPWYVCRPVALPDDLLEVPVHLPTLAQVERLFLSFEANVAHLEKALNQRRRRDARAKRVNNPYLVFKDVKAAGACPVETLLEGPESLVEASEPEDCSVILQTPIQLDPAMPVTVNQNLCNVVHAEPDRLWLDRTEPVAPGSKVRQDRLLGALPDMFQAFGAEWGRRWCKHADCPVERWQDAILTSGLEVPIPEVSFPDITPVMWRAEVRRKKATTATGLDGISRQDLLLIPDDLLQHVLDIYREAESSGRWPAQALQAVITALEKRPDAERVGQFRPITIISLVYRVWSGIRSRQRVFGTC